MSLYQLLKGKPKLAYQKNQQSQILQKEIDAFEKWLTITDIGIKTGPNPSVMDEYVKLLNSFREEKITEETYKEELELLQMAAKLMESH